MNNKMELQQTIHLFDIDAMTQDIKKAKWYLLDLDSRRRSIKMTQLELLDFINRAFSKQFTLDQIDTQKIFGHRDNVYMILRDNKGDLS